MSNDHPTRPHDATPMYGNEGVVPYSRYKAVLDRAANMELLIRQKIACTCGDKPCVRCMVLGDK